MKNFYTDVLTPCGKVILRSDGTRLIGLYFDGQKHMPSMIGWHHDPQQPLLMKVSQQVTEYFNGVRTTFDFPYHCVGGTLFQQKVWRALERIPYGKLTSYGVVAQMIGAPRAVRAVGSAIGRNPLSVIIPCHRVVGGDGALTGYAGSLPRKQKLLQLERVL